MTGKKQGRLALIGAFILLGVAACAQSQVGPDSLRGNTLSEMKWSDGQPAYSISCDLPGGCMHLAQRQCAQGYKTLKQDNMPIIGSPRLDASTGPPSVVIRCGG